MTGHALASGRVEHSDRIGDALRSSSQILLLAGHDVRVIGRATSPPRARIERAGGGPGPAVELSAQEARRALLRAQGLLGAADLRAGVPGVLSRLDAVQLDTISVLARSHELVAYARLGAVGRGAVEAAYWSDPPSAFEYWSHAACVVPLDLWPWFAFRRRHFRERNLWRRRIDPAVREEVLRELRASGPLTATQLGGAKQGGEWWDWSPLKVAAEQLLAEGEVVCTRREGWRRVYDLAERAIPAELACHDPDDESCWTELVTRAGARLGVATVADLADHHRLRARDVLAVIERTPLVPVRVAGWGARGWAHPDALAALETRGRHRTTLLSPFDTVVWDRARTERVFDFRHRLEAYVPAPLRLHGYFAMPLLTGGRLAGRVDPAREGSTLVARRLTVEPRAVGAMARALREAATWVGCDSVRIERAEPAGLRAPLEAALR